MKERLTPPEDNVVCLCGNTEKLDGFHPCDEAGSFIEPAVSWKRLFACHRCGRIIDRDTWEVIGNALPEDGDVPF